MAAAVALTAGFYALAVAVVAALLAVAVVPWVAGHGNPFISITAFVLAGSIAVGVAPRRHRFAPPGVRVTHETQPDLVSLIDDEAAAAGERPPDEVYVTFEVNAAVTEAGRGRRVMIVGLPLLHLVSERGLRSVIAHELGHYAGGDVRLGPWIWRTRSAIARTVERLTSGDESFSQKIVRQPFIWYGHAFLRITNAISRRQEFAADERAARRAGRDVHVATLRQIHAYGPAFDSYWTNEVAPILSVGRRPPVGAGFVAFTRAPAIERAATAHLERELTEGRTDPYDSHPSLAERIAAVEALPAGDTDESPAAATLLRDGAALERAQAVHVFGAEAGELQPVDWDAVGAEVYLERAQRLVAAHGDLLGDATAGDLGDLVDHLGPIAGTLQVREPKLEVEHARDFAGALIADGLLVALHEGGWAVEAPPAEPVLCRRGDDRVAPHVVVDQLRDGRLSGAEWRAGALALGIGGFALRSRKPHPGPASDVPK
jgi:Zn-dependent protease with chaperone function